MKFIPLTDKQIAEANLIPEGEYDFEVIEADYHVSQKSGKESIKLRLKIWRPDGSLAFLDEYLTPTFARKWKNAAIACGLKQEYESGEIEPTDFIGKAAKVKLKIDKDSTGSGYPDRNAIVTYIAYESPTRPVNSSISPEDFFGDIDKLQF